MPTTRTRILAALLAAAGLLAPARPLAAQDSAPPRPADVKALAVYPAKVALTGSDDAAQLVVTATLADGRLQDLTGEVQYAVADGKTAAVTSAGRVLPRANGASEIIATFGGKAVKLPVEVKHLGENLPLNFTNQVVPVFTKLGWNGTWLPLIVPHFFANAFNVFLLRQYFLSIPRDLDEAAMIDGASPFRVLRSVILPLSVPALVAVTLFHFFFSWNDFFLPLLYLSGKPDLQTLPIAIQQYNALYVTQPALIQAAALMTMVVPVVVFFLAQRSFMRGVVVTGVEK